LRQWASESWRRSFLVDESVPKKTAEMAQDWLVVAALDSVVEVAAAAGAGDALGAFSAFASVAFVSDEADSAAGALLLAA